MLKQQLALSVPDKVGYSRVITDTIFLNEDMSWGLFIKPTICLYDGHFAEFFSLIFIQKTNKQNKAAIKKNTHKNKTN